MAAVTSKPLSKVHRAFGRRVRWLREDRGYTQERLAERADLHPTYVGGVERGTRNPSLGNITKIAKALDVRLAELFDGI